MISSPIVFQITHAGFEGGLKTLTLKGAGAVIMAQQTTRRNARGFFMWEVHVRGKISIELVDAVYFKLQRSTNQVVGATIEVQA